MSSAPQDCDAPYDLEARRDTPLALKLKERIRREGPISIADYMQACLQDPEHGYYINKTAIGARGDFVTAPEISQIFGEVIGLWSAVVWQQMGSPEKVNLVELGPGRGTLMRDALRASRIVPGFHDAVAVTMIESSDPLQTIQLTTLSSVPVPVRWTRGVTSFPAPAIILANEFLDALPVEQWIKTQDGWHERGVGLDDKGEFCFRALPDSEVRNSPGRPSTDVILGPSAKHVFLGPSAKHVLGMTPEDHRSAGSDSEGEPDAVNTTIAPGSTAIEEMDSRESCPRRASHWPGNDNNCEQNEALDRQFPEANPGSIVERMHAAFVTELLTAPARPGPVVMLFVDYGHAASSVGETLQAVRNHTFESPLSSPGEADLSSHVDFSKLAGACHAAGFETDGPITQAEFLGRLGLIERASKLMSANPSKAGEIETAIARLMAPGGMGGRFKAMGVRSSGLPKLPGF